MLSWQNSWNSKQIAVDIKQKLAVQEEVLDEEVLRQSYLPFLIK